ncbi:hypothetical protein ACOMHN_011311 [Nucella lapillus]
MSPRNNHNQPRGEMYSSQEDINTLHKSSSCGAPRNTVWRQNALAWTALALVLLASGVASSQLPNTADATTATSSTSQDPFGRKEFPVSRLNDLLKDFFQKRRAQLWERMFQNREQRRGPGSEEEAEEENEGGRRNAGGGGGGGGGRRRRRRSAEEKKLLSVEQEDRLDTFVGEVMACQEIPGLSLGMVRGGARQGTGYGVGDMETGRTVDKDTLFGIGSNSKAFGAATLAHLMVTLPPEKRFSFDTRMTDILKDDFQLPDPLRTQETTVMDVLSHRTGLGSADLGIFSGYPSNLTTRQLCRRLQFLPEMVPFRSAWYYSNTMFALVSRLCEVTAGKNWTEVLEEAIWQPLEMNDTLLSPEALSRDNVALPYIIRMRVYDMFVQQDPRLFDIHPLQAAGAIMSSATDMTKWLAHLMQTLKRPQGVAMSVLRQIFTERTLLPAFLRQVAKFVTAEPIIHIGYGMGMMTSYYKSHLVYWHTGDFHGYNSMMLLVPDLDTSVYVAVNGPSSSTTGKAVQHLVYFVLELLQGNEPWVNLSQVCPNAAKEAPTPDPNDDYDYPGDDTRELDSNSQVLLRPIEDYLGTYGHGLLGDVKIVREEERNSLLRMELGRLLVADLIPTNDANIFKVAPRSPVADTKEWGKEHNIIFKSTTAGTSKAELAKEESSEKLDSAKNDSKNVTKEKDILPPLDQVQMRWELETYVFKRSVRFDSALPQEEGEHEDDEPGQEPEPILSTQSSAVLGGDSGAGLVRPAQIGGLLMLCSAFMTLFY